MCLLAQTVVAVVVVEEKRTGTGEVNIYPGSALALSLICHAMAMAMLCLDIVGA